MHVHGSGPKPRIHERVKMMTYEEFLSHIIERGIASAKASYANDKVKLKGAIEGFELCRGRSPDAIKKLLDETNDTCNKARDGGTPAYWHARYRQLQVEWVANVLSAGLMSNGHPVIITPTTRGVILASEILGVAGGTIGMQN